MNPMITSDLDLPIPEPDSDLDEKTIDEVTNITPDDSMDGQPDGLPDPQEAAPLATDHEAMKKEYFAIPEDLESIAETTYTWNIKDWRRHPKRELSENFQCGNAPWHVLFFPYGNTQNDYCSFYLEQGFEDKPPEDWYACLQFMLVLWNPNDPSIQVRHTATHRYSAEESDWGFTRFVEHRRLMRFANDGRGLLEDECANLTAYVRVIKDPTGVLWHSFNNYDSKKETGMVGIKNQGATCYLNSLLQSLYFTNAFRKAIYQIPTTNETDVRNNSAYALQRLYYMLQSNDNAASTTELTASFGWESRQIFEQQDVQELSRILMDKMEERMKGTPAEKVLPALFVGRMKTYIDCINVDFESSRREDFWDIQLNVRGNATLDDSFKDYIQVETMDGDNKYFAEGHGLQDARKGVIFESFPQVLHLQLKRFEYNFQADAMTKVYDRYEFPEVWDASPYLSDSADQSEPYIYHLHGVLVHSGDLNAGHYYAFLKPEKNGHFYKFDDDRVTRATPKEAMDENFGGDFAPQANGVGGGQRNPYTRTWSKQRFMSAYMLVYIRESRLDSVLHGVQQEDTPPHLEQKLSAERADSERKRKDREEAHLYMHVHVGTDDNFNAHQGFDVFPMNASLFDGEHPSIPKMSRQLKTTDIASLTRMLAEDLSIDQDLIRPWGLVGRQNSTVRPDTPLIYGDVTLEEAASTLQSRAPLRLWIEIGSKKSDGTPDFPPNDTLVEHRLMSKEEKDRMPILLFLKHFDVVAQTLKGAGHIYMPKNQRINELGPLINQRMGWPEGTKTKLFEEIKKGMIDAMKTTTTFAFSELQHGDIICYEKVLPESELTALQEAGKYIDPPSFYTYLAHRVEISFSERSDPDAEAGTFRLELSKISTYDQIAMKVAIQLNVDPTHLRFSTVHSQTGKPRTFVKRGANQTLSSIFSPGYSSYGSVLNQRSDWLFYEVLDIPLAELENKKMLKISLVTEGITKEEVFETLVPKSGLISEITPALAKKAGPAQLPPEVLEHLRYYESHSGRISRELTPSITVSQLNEWTTIYAEAVPPEMVEAQDADERAISCFHFDRELSKTHGVPFRFVVRKGEVWRDTRERLVQRTGLKDKKLDKCKFAVVSRSALGKPEYLTDDDILDERLITQDDQLGLDHVNKSKPAGNKADVMMIR